MWANFQRIIELFTQKIVKSSQKYGFGIRDPGSEIRDPRSGIRDPGSGKNLFRIPDPGVKKAPDPGSGSATLGITKNSMLGNRTFFVFVKKIYGTFSIPYPYGLMPSIQERERLESPRS
jgi:hypothetical protein